MIWLGKFIAKRSAKKFLNSLIDIEKNNPDEISNVTTCIFIMIENLDSSSVTEKTQGQVKKISEVFRKFHADDLMKLTDYLSSYQQRLNSTPNMQLHAYVLQFLLLNTRAFIFVNTRPLVAEMWKIFERHMPDTRYFSVEIAATVARYKNFRPAYLLNQNQSI